MDSKSRDLKSRDSKSGASKSRQIVIACAALILSAIAWYFGTGLHPHWYLTWLAPLPVLLAAPRLPRWPALAVAFAGFAFGACNSWRYDLVVVPLWLLLVMIVVPALVFAWIVLIHRAFILRGQLLRAALALPVLWCAVEYLLEFRSPHSTWGNLGYTQMDFLPILQIASITGIWAISFAVFFFSSTIAALTAPSRSDKQFVAVIATVFYAIVFGYGFYRLHSDRQSPHITAALIATDNLHTLSPTGAGAVSLVRAYAGHIPELAAQGAQVVIVPEKIARIQGVYLDQADAILEQAARDSRVTILVSFEHQPNLHQARLYSPDGKLEATYEKHHMLPKFESYLLPGTARVVVDRPSGRWGIEICKDMDFPLLSRQYALDGAGLMLVPAWDFIADGWLHGRMAVMRGVESGFSIARVAKQGILSLSDDRGRILAERPSNAAPFSELIGSLPVRNEPTFYARTGDWFAWLDLALAVVLFLPIRR